MLTGFGGGFDNRRTDPRLHGDIDDTDIGIGDEVYNTSISFVNAELVSNFVEACRVFIADCSDVQTFAVVAEQMLLPDAQS